MPFTEKKQNPTELGVLRKGVGKRKSVRWPSLVPDLKMPVSKNWTERWDRFSRRQIISYTPFLAIYKTTWNQNIMENSEELQYLTIFNCKQNNDPLSEKTLPWVAQSSYCIFFISLFTVEAYSQIGFSFIVSSPNPVISSHKWFFSLFKLYMKGKDTKILGQII